MKLEEIYPLLSASSVVVFAVCLGFHVITITEVWPLINAVVGAIVVLCVPVIFLAQFLMIFAAKGCRFFPERGAYEPGRSWKYFRVALGCIPKPTRVFGLLFWYVYTPASFVYCLMSDNLPACCGLVLAAFGLVHFLGFRYVLPNRELIIQTVNQSAAK